MPTLPPQTSHPATCSQSQMGRSRGRTAPVPRCTTPCTCSSTPQGPAWTAEATPGYGWCLGRPWARSSRGWACGGVCIRVGIRGPCLGPWLGPTWTLAGPWLDPGWDPLPGPCLCEIYLMQIFAFLKREGREERNFHHNELMYDNDKWTVTFHKL